jgi:hypothetical protein
VRIRFFFAWFDLWIGAYWRKENRTLYICPLPCCVIRIRFPMPHVIRDEDEFREVYGEPERGIPVPVQVIEKDISRVQVARQVLVDCERAAEDTEFSGPESMRPPWRKNSE